MRRSDFDTLVREVLQDIPDIFRSAMDNLEIIVQDWPNRKLMEEVSGDPEEIVYGLFVGRTLPERHYDDWGNIPDVILIYQKPLEEDFPNRADLIRELEVTIVHEIAHYMGFGEEKLAEYGYD